MVVNDARYCFDVELVENVIFSLKRGKAAGLDGITAERLRFSHCLLSCVLSKLYNFMLRLAYCLIVLVYPTLSL